MKRVLSFVLAFLLVFSLSGSIVLAESGTSSEDTTENYTYDDIAKILDAIERTNVKLYKEIMKAVEKAATSKNPQEDYLYKLIVSLIVKTEKTADKMVEKAADGGLVVEKYYIEIIIGDNTVWVDPCKVLDE